MFSSQWQPLSTCKGKYAAYLSVNDYDVTLLDKLLSGFSEQIKAGFRKGDLLFGLMRIYLYMGETAMKSYHRDGKGSRNLVARVLTFFGFLSQHKQVICDLSIQYLIFRIQICITSFCVFVFYILLFLY